MPSINHRFFFQNYKIGTSKSMSGVEGDPKEVAKLPWYDNATMLATMNSSQGRKALQTYLGSKGFTEGKRFTGFMLMVYDKDFRYHITQVQ